MNYINLRKLELKTFTEQNALDYCLISNINSKNITELRLTNNKLTDISGIKIFKNLTDLHIDNNELTDISSLKYLNNIKELWLDNNKIKDISVLQYLNNLEVLSINELKLESDQIEYIKSLNNLKQLYCYNGFKDMSIINKLNKKFKLWIY